MKTIKLTNNKEVVVTKLPLKKYVELLKGLQDLPQHVLGLDGLSNEEAVAKLPEVIASALPDVVRLLSLATDLTEEEIYELGLDEVVDIFVAIVEVNNYAKIYNRLKKVTARPVAELKK